MNIPLPVSEDLDEVLPILIKAGWEVKTSLYSPESFGNYLVCFERNGRPLDITRDRGQYILGGDRQLLVSLGYWRALETKQELVAGVSSFVAAAA